MRTGKLIASQSARIVESTARAAAPGDTATSTLFAHCAGGLWRSGGEVGGQPPSPRVMLSLVLPYAAAISSGPCACLMAAAQQARHPATAMDPPGLALMQTTWGPAGTGISSETRPYFSAGIGAPWARRSSFKVFEMVRPGAPAWCVKRPPRGASRW